MPGPLFGGPKQSFKYLNVRICLRHEKFFIQFYWSECRPMKQCISPVRRSRGLRRESLRDLRRPFGAPFLRNPCPVPSLIFANGGFFMASKSCSVSFGFCNLPSNEFLLAFATRLDDRRLAGHRPAVSKLLKCVPTIRYSLEQGWTLQVTCELLMEAHQVKVSRSALCRFLAQHPQLRAPAPMQHAQVQGTVKP